MIRSFLLLLTVIASLSSYACKCATLSFSDEVKQADLVFTGTVLSKTMGDKVYYLFTISKTFKGSSADTLTIQTGFGDGDCGMLFEEGKTYLVYANNKGTNSCRRNALAANNADISRLKYLFDSSFSRDIGKAPGFILTGNEAEYLNDEFTTQRKDFDFYGKKTAFVLSSSIIDKEQFFKDWGGNEFVSNLIILTGEEKQQANGYDAIIVLWRKQGVGKSFRKKLIKRLAES